MEVQTIKIKESERYILLDDNFKPVKEVNDYLKLLDLTNKARNTIKNYAFHLKTYCEFLNYEGLEIDALFINKERSPINILSNFMKYLEYPKNYQGILSIHGEEPARDNKTINIIVNTILSFYEYLSKDRKYQEIDIYKTERNNQHFKGFLSELIQKENTKKTSLLRKKEVTKEIEYATREQYNELLKHCNLIRDKIVLALLFEGGLRLNETLGIHLEDLDEIQDGIIKIVPRENNENMAVVKNHAKGIIKIPDYVIDMIIKYINGDILEYDSNFLFLNLYGKNKGRPLRDITVQKLFTRLSSKIGEDISPHKLRHGFATEKLNYGWKMEDISVYLRHKNLSSTQIYAHYSDSLKKEKMVKFLKDNKLDSGGVLSDGQLNKIREL